MKKLVKSLLLMLLAVTLVTGCGIKNNTENNNDENNKVNDNTAVYSGDGYEFEYNNRWVPVTLANGTIGLKYMGQKAYMAPVGKSTLLGYNFDTNDDKKLLYDRFYEIWSKDSTLYSGSNGFKLLKDNIYYATYDYGSSTEVRGKYYLLVSKEKDVVLSFMSNAETDVDGNNERTLNMLKTIKIN